MKREYMKPAFMLFETENAAFLEGSREPKNTTTEVSGSSFRGNLYTGNDDGSFSGNGTDAYFYSTNDESDSNMKNTGVTGLE